MKRILPCAVLLLVGCSREPETPAQAITATPLPARTADDGPRFRRLDPAVSGLAFTNELRRPNIVPYVYSGAGVAVADYDQDGLPDVYLVSQDGPNKLFRQVAPMRFEDVTAAAGGLHGGDAWGTAATFADVDGDGDLDLYVCNLESPNLLYLNQGDGTFREGAGRFGLAIVAASTGAAFADYDNDGDLDLYLLTNRVFGPKLPQQIVDEVQLPGDMRKTRAQLFPPYPHFETRDGRPVVPAGYEDFFHVVDRHLFAAGQADRLLRNDGYAQWRDVSATAGIRGHDNGLAVVWWDWDGDGWLDLYIANDLQSPDRLYHNRRDGTFVEITGAALPHTAFFGMGADFGDIDNDGRLDFCVGDMSSTTHYMGKMLMGSMGDHRWFLMNARPPQYMRNAVYLNSGTDRFLEAAHLLGLASTDWTWTVRFADLDEDGWLDFYATNGISQFEDNPDAGMEFRRLWQQGRREQALEIARNLPRVDERNIARRNLGDLRFQDVGAEWGLDELGVSHGAVIADLDRDGDLDIVVNNLNGPASVMENRTSHSRRILVSLRGTAGNVQGVGSRITVLAGGLTQTRLVMPTRGYMSSGEAVEHFGLGQAARIDRLTVQWPGGRRQEFTDLAADQHYVIRHGGEVPAAAAPTPAAAATWFTAGQQMPVRHAEREFDDYAVQPLLPHRLSQLGPGIAWGDVDGDGRDDLWIGGAAGQAGSLLRALGDGTFAPLAGPWQQDAECEDLGAAFLDFDGDGDLDLFVVSGGVEAGERTELLRDRIYRNDGAGGFARAPEDVLPDLRRSGSCVAAVDFDRDGDLDLFVGSRVVPGRFPEAPPSALLRNDGGRFVDVTAELAPTLLQAGMVSAAVWTDWDDDGWPDLVVAAQWQPVRLLRNRDGRLVDATQDAGLGGLSGLWNSVAAGDLDGDGDVDLVVGNLGLNTKYKAAPDHPLFLYAADFDQNGTLDVVEAKHQGDATLPVRGRSCSSEAMPFLAERFPTFDAFARATLPEIYGAEALQRSQELQAVELRHLVLENRAGRFVPQPLPRLAQIAPVFGIGIADLDGDGRVDLALAQNFFSPEPETGRFDGGLGQVLAGRGGLTWEALPAHRSGLRMPEDGKGLTLTDLDGDGVPDLCCTANDGPVRTFVAAPRDGVLAVRLAGGPGNPTAVGARLTLRRADGSRQHQEIQAGAGYLSQSPPVAWFTGAAGGRLEIRWPDGHTSQQDVAEGSGMLQVER